MRHMTPEQSKTLKVGAVVCFNGEPTDRGKITAIESRYVVIKWDDGNASFTGHNNMQRIELIRASKAR
jgi:hypothetical protein